MIQQRILKRIGCGICCFACLLMLTIPLHAEINSGIDQIGVDRSIRPQDDLYLHVNGEWLKHTPIPNDKSNYGSFSILIDEALFNLRTLIEEAANTDHPVGTDEQKVGGFYRSFMNQELVNQLDLAPLQVQLDRIQVLTSLEGVVSHFGRLQKLDVTTPVGFFVDQDDKDSSRHIMAFVQSGTTLPDRDYYLEDDEKYLMAREALKSYVRKLFALAKLPNGDAAAEAILEIETKLADVQWERTQLRNADKRYNKYEFGRLLTEMPGIPWRAFLASAGVAEPADVNVMTPSYFEGLQKIFSDTSTEAWKQYLAFQLIDSFAPYLSDDFVEAHFDLHAKELAGVPQQKPRWKRAVEATAGARAGDFGMLGDVVGRLYVGKHFAPSAKQEMDQLVQNLVKAYQSSIGDLTWMTDTTKQRALEKLTKIRTKIGYPDKWRDYSNLEIHADDLVGNIIRSHGVEYQRMIDKLGKPVDRDEWGMTPQTVNAYYNPGMNEIVFPAAILQPPFFDADADDAVNYGGIGAVIGHEISHGFDDQGSKYDGDGNLEDWWTNRDRLAFRELTNRLVNQFTAYEPLPGKHVNGELTLGENIADLSGMSIAFKAYRLSLDGQSAPMIDEWTGSQRFFLGWAQIWRRKYRDAEMIRRLLTDPHSPSRYRANGPLTNVDAFYEAFDVQPGDGLYRPKADRIQIW